MRLNILIISGSLGGVERHTTDILNELSSRDYNIYHIVPTGYKTSTPNTEYFEIPREICLKDIQVFYKILKYFFSIKDTIHIIHGHSSKGGLYARLLFFFSKAKIYYSPHAFYTMNTSIGLLKQTVIKYAEKLLSFFTKKIILSSTHEKSHAIEFLKIDSAKIIINPNCADTIKSLAINDIDKDGVVFGFCGRLVNQKNPLEVINIAKRLSFHNFKCKFLILGEGYLKEALIESISENQLQNVQIIPKSNLDLFFNKINVLLVTSMYEGNPYLYQDALAYSKPIITSNVGGSNYYVENYKNGYIYNDMDDLCDFVVNNLANDLKFSVYSEHSYKVSKRYPLGKMIDSLEHIYNNDR